jgi:hypothetical protein
MAFKNALLLMSVWVSAVTVTADSHAGSGGNVIEHVKVYHERGRFGGWPANHGIWCWGNEILVGFSAGYYKDLGPTRHNIDHDKPEEHLLARSKDGGRTWSIEHPADQQVLVGTAGMRHGVVPPGASEREPVPCPGGINFAHPDFAMTCRMAGVHTGVSRFYYSYDRGHTWKGPFSLPLFGQPGIAARTDYLIDGSRECTLFLTASKRNRREGRPICVRTLDGGKSWSFLSYIGPEPSGYAIMPSTVRLSPRDLLTTIRRAEDRGPRRSWIEAWSSSDDGTSWKLLNEPVPDTGEGNAPHLIRLADGRLCLTYGRRAKPYGIFARLSSDAGRTWSETIVLRDDGGGRDIGYPRSVQRPDGKVVTVYYFWEERSGPERYIAATIWSPTIPGNSGTDAELNTSARKAALAMSREQASSFARLALNGIQKEYPNKPADVLNADTDVMSPRRMHPAFHGSYDWHSSVHGHWMLVRLLRLFPGLPERQEVRRVLDEHLTAKNLQAEADYFARSNAQSFERTYGWAWLLKLAEELHDWDDPQAKQWSANLRPLANKIADLYIAYLPKQTYPIRSGVHPNTAFGLAFALDYARAIGSTALQERVEERSRNYFANDVSIPAAWEPDGTDFFSPSLMEADLMRRVLSPDDFRAWLQRFLPGLAKGEPASLVTSAQVTDRSDPQLVHLDGLNLSRAWCMRSIALALPREDAARKVLAASAARHAESALRHVASGHYAGEHWLASFAVYLLSTPTPD